MKVKGTLSGIFKSIETVVHPTKYLGRLDGWTLFISVGLRCIFQIIFETVYQHEKTKPLKNGTNQELQVSCSSLIFQQSHIYSSIK